MDKFYICTFGCRCNQADSASIGERLDSRSMRQTARPEEADLIVVNSCTVTRRSDQQVRQAVRKLHRENPQAKLVVTGCYAQRDPEALARIPGVSLVVGNREKDRLDEFLVEGQTLSGAIIWTPVEQSAKNTFPLTAQAGGRTRPFLKLQDGCDARCAYCIVPSVRGPGRSAAPDAVVREMERLVGLGYQEIVLTGVNLGAYGCRLNPPVALTELLRRIFRIPGLGRLRLSSIEPMRVGTDLTDLAREQPAFAPHFHIPLQSGSDRILRKMRRPYRAGRYLDLVGSIREKLPGAAIGTDVLVGFPGETDEDFEATYRLVESSPLTYMHVFPFSAREGTAAFDMPERVPPQAARERARLLRALSREKNLAFRRRFEGQMLEAVTLSQEEGLGASAALTGNFIHAKIDADGVEPNRLVKLRIRQARRDVTLATIE